MSPRLLGAIVAAVPVLAPAAELVVGPGRAFASLRSALAAAAPGDTVVVHPGIYREGSLVLDRPVTLRGVGGPVLDGEGTAEILTVAAPGSVIRGLVLRNGGHGSLRDVAAIRVEGVTGAVIEGNVITGCSFGIYLARSREIVVRENVVTADPGRVEGNGIHAWSCERLELVGNQVARHRDGIYLEFATDSEIAANRVEDCLRYGLHFMSAHRNTYRGNRFLRNGAGVAVMYSRDVCMEGNLFADSWGAAAYGLLLKDISGARVRGNTFARNSVGVTVQGSSQLAFERNGFLANGWALQLESGGGGFTCRASNFQGNAFDVSSRGDLGEGGFSGNYWDKAELYDLDRDGVGDVPHRPLSVFAQLVDRVPAALLLLRSPLAHFLDRAERVFPTLTPDRVADPCPRMRPHPAAAETARLSLSAP